MGSIKSNKVHNSSLASGNGVHRKSVRTPIGTHRNNKSFKDEFSGSLSEAGNDIGTVFGFVAKGLKSYFGAYYEAALAIKEITVQSAQNLCQRVNSLLGSKTSPNVDLEEDVKNKTSGNSSGKSQVSGSTFWRTDIKAKPRAINKPKVKHERKFLEINISEFERLLPKETAELLLLKVIEEIDPNEKLFLFLNDIANDQPFSIAANRFGVSHNLKLNETQEAVMNKARMALIEFIKQSTNNNELAEKIIDFICVSAPQVQVIEEVEVVEWQEEVERNEVVQFALSEEVIDEEPVIISIPIKRPCRVNPESLIRIQSYQRLTGINGEAVDEFLQLNKNDADVCSAFSQEELILRVGFLEALSELKVKNNVDKFPTDLILLENEYGAFLRYCSADVNLRSEIGIMLDASSNSETHSYSTRKDIAAFLSTKEHDALIEARRFIRRLVELDANSADGAMRLFRKALEAEKREPGFVFGFYRKAEAALSLLKQFNSSYLPPNICKMTIVNSTEAKNLDLKLETTDKIYLIKIKSNFYRVVESIREIKSIAGRVKGLEFFNGLEAPFEKKKKIIPVCVVYGAGNTITDLENRLINEDNNKEFCNGLRDLLAIKTENEKFELWDINGRNIGDELKVLLNPAIGIFQDFQVA